jgi:hypothetical protein
MSNKLNFRIARATSIAFLASIAAMSAKGGYADDKQPATLYTGSVLVSLSNSHRTLYGYSVNTGSWDKVRLDKPIKEFQPIASGREACVVVGSHVYAFSGVVGRWDSIEVADAKEPPVPIVDADDRIRVVSGSKIYMFSAITGRWAAADMAVDAD